MITPAHAQRTSASYPVVVNAAAAPDRLAAPAAALVILGLSLALWAVVGIGAAWLAGWI